MALIPSGTKFIGLAPTYQTVERRSALINNESQPYTMQDIIDTAGVSLAPQMYIVVLDQSGTNPPVATDIVTDFDPTTINRNNVGSYTFLFPAGTFTAKTIATLTLQGSNPASPVGVAGLTLNWDLDRIDIVTKNPATGAAADGYLSGARLSIQVYE
jgi:hypothetical protein